MTADRRTIAVYGGKAGDYEQLVLGDPQERALESFLGYLPVPSRILDLGCGPGLQAARMADAGHRVEAIDATPAFVEAARARGVAARLDTFDSLDEEDRFDGIWASFSLLHDTRAAFPRTLARIARALKPGGLLFLGLKLGTGEGRDALGRFYSYFSEAELRRHLDSQGFRIAKVETGSGRGLSGADEPFILILAHG